MNTELKQTLDKNKYAYTEIDGSINITHQGDVNLYSLTTLPAGTKFENQGGVYLSSLTTLPAGTKFENQGGVYLNSLTTLPEGTKFENQGGVYLSSLTTLPAGTKFENQGGVYLYSLTTLPEGTKFENQGGVYLYSLTAEKQAYQGKDITLHHIDGYTMLIESEKIKKGVTICKARYFGGGVIDKLESCYLAKVGNHWAHGKTVKEAIQDATDKAVIDMDQSEVVAEIKASGKVTLAQYRAITGACREGCRQFLQSIGKPDATELSIEEVKELVKGHYGYDRFIEAINQ